MKKNGTIGKSKKKIDKEMEERMKKKIAHETMENVYLKYSIMRVRLKINFHCYMKDYTLTELWMNQILKSFKFLAGSSQIPLTSNKSLSVEIKLETFFPNKFNNCLSKIMETIIKQLE